MKRQTILLLSIVFLCLITNYAKAEYIFNDGGIHNIDYPIGDRVRVENSLSDMPTTVNLLDGGSILGVRLVTLGDSQINIFGGWVSRIAADDNSQVTMSGGTVNGYLSATGNASIKMIDGIVGGDLQGWSNGYVLISGGSVNGYLSVFDSSQIIIIGSNFSVDGIPVSFGKYFADDFVGGSGVITGILKNGDLLNNSFYISTNASITLVPIPATILLGIIGLGIGGWKLRKSI